VGWAIAVLMTLVLAGGVAGDGRAVSEPELKAVFLYNFVNFVEWPPDAMAVGDHIQVCVVGDTSVAELLRTAVHGRTVWNRQISVTAPPIHGPLHSCHLLYVADVDAKVTRQLVQTLKGASVFSVSDFKEFAVRGGVANFFTHAGRLRFAVNLDAARRARLQISSKMLMLATVVQEEL
jgi:hypothetical protein